VPPASTLAARGVGESSPVDEQSDDAGLRTLARNCGRPDLGATAIANTDNRVVKNEQVRFNFGDRAQVLEHSLYPTPEPELGVVQVHDSGLTSLDYVYRIEQLEVGDQVGFLFVLSSQTPSILPRRASVRLLRLPSLVASASAGHLILPVSNRLEPRVAVRSGTHTAPEAAA
jgi:hypothetical protein